MIKTYFTVHQTGQSIFSVAALGIVAQIDQLMTASKAAESLGIVGIIAAVALYFGWRNTKAENQVVQMGEKQLAAEKSISEVYKAEINTLKAELKAERDAKEAVEKEHRLLLEKLAFKSFNTQ